MYTKNKEYNGYIDKGQRNCTVRTYELMMDADYSK